MSRLTVAALAVAFWTAALIAIAWGANIAISEALTPGGAKPFHGEGNTL